MMDRFNVLAHALCAVLVSAVVATTLTVLPADAQGRVGGLPFEIEPFAGQLRFDADLDLPRQNLAGAQVGLGLSPFATLRGYYWRGVTGDFDGFEPLQSYGGELQFHLFPGLPVFPHLLAGFGRLDFQDDYGEDVAAIDAPPASRNTAILGAGLGFNVTRRAQFNLAARNYLFGDVALDEVESTDDLFHNWLYSAGLNISLGGARPRDEPPEQPVAAREARVDTVYIRGDEERIERPRPSDEDIADARIVRVPVPEEGVLYIRYGREGDETVRIMPGQRGAERAYAPRNDAEDSSIREMIREELARAAPADTQDVAEPPPESGLSDEDLNRLEQRITERLDSLMRAREEESGAAPPADDADASPEQAQMDTDGFPTARDTEAERQRSRARAGGARALLPWRTWDAQLYSGVEAGSPLQSSLGWRMNLGPPFARLSSLHLVPELSLGYGGGDASLLGAANLQYRFGGLDRLGLPLRPHAYIGAGLIRSRGSAGGSGPVLNAGYGASIGVGQLIGPALEGTDIFMEHQGVQLFDRNRFLLGLTMDL